ncbi:GNAT family N-acetyltransferase [Cyanobium sp. NIES-981]|uniref:GNAT family N-acetyltransferase n=1 Tax=Cyanobium sp. NIES-981 TaxID=1851505 RepID=UPI0007DCBE9A|nr:GNAT family N-acetyltransferase [Cyanobium sp. NIES-981]SBO42255.1 GCN5-related N-acetyltransferase [Cyanobium sp. NIES-981]
MGSRAETSGAVAGQGLIRTLSRRDIPQVVAWARAEGFCPGEGDVAIYRHTDRQGVWVKELNHQLIGCIAGVRYNAEYGFVGMFLVDPAQRGRGHGLSLWRTAMDHLADLPCVGLEAALGRVEDYRRWGFEPASPTQRWQLVASGEELAGPGRDGLELVQGEQLPQRAVQAYDAQREPSPRPHFLADWLGHPAGTVLALIDAGGQCHGFGRIRPCLLRRGSGWRIGPLLADDPALAERLLRGMLARHPGVVLIDVPGANRGGDGLMERLGFHRTDTMLRMYRGRPPAVGLDEVFGLACLELG